MSFPGEIAHKADSPSGGRRVSRVRNGVFTFHSRAVYDAEKLMRSRPQDAAVW